MTRDVKVGFPKKKKALYDVHVAIYVPSTKYDKVISSAQLKGRVKATTRFLNALFGGSTHYNATGTWTDVKHGNKIIKEKIIKVDCFATAKDYRKAQIKLQNWIRKKRVQWKQEALSFEFEEELHFIE